MEDLVPREAHLEKVSNGETLFEGSERFLGKFEAKQQQNKMEMSLLYSLLGPQHLISTNCFISQLFVMICLWGP